MLGRQIGTELGGNRGREDDDVVVVPVVKKVVTWLLSVW
jgi:hypothetical protein